MAYTDWDIIGSSTAILNSDVSGANTLPGGFGTFCRRFADISSLLISGSVQSGAFVGVASNKVIRTTCAIRKFTNTNIYNGGFVSKYAGGFNCGYSVCYDAIPQAICLKLNDGTIYVLPVVYPPGGNIDNTWFNMRMEVEEISPGTDRILVSQEDPLGSGTFTLLSINGGIPADGIQITSVDPRYAAWGGVGRNGIVSQIQPGHQFGGIYFDKYEIELLDP